MTRRDSMGRRLVLIVGVLAVVATSLVLVPTGAASAATTAPVDDAAPVAPGLRSKAAEGEVRVIAVTVAPGEQVVDGVVAAVPESAVTDVEAGPAPQVVATVDAEGLDALSRAPGVTQVVEDKINRVADDTWPATTGVAAAQTAGWDGAGRTVAVLDAGVQSDHPFLAGKVLAEGCFSTNAPGIESLCAGGVSQLTGVAGAAAPCVGIAGCTHGTHVAGLAVGGPDAGAPGLTGTAPGASLIAAKVFSKATTSGICGSAPPCLVAFDSDIIAAMTWIRGQRQLDVTGFNTLDAVNLSLGGGLYSSICDAQSTAFKAAVDSLRDLGVLTVAAAGNNGARGSISSPACISTVVSVGATNGAGSIPSFSNLSSFTTLLAPGVSMTSSIPPSTYGRMSGTSMATPVVTGAIAAAREKLSSTRTTGAGATSIVELLRTTGTPVSGLPELQLDAALLGVPSDVQQLVPTVGNAGVTLAWSAPSYGGTSAITGYTVTASPGGGSCSTGTTSCAVTGLSNGTTYTFVVKATNSAGSGAGTSVSATPAGAPGAPTSASALAGDRRATVSWAAPASNGGSAVTGYLVTASPGGQTCSAGPSTTSCVVTGLGNGVATTFSVVASNAVGPGAASVASAAVVPKIAGTSPVGSLDVAGALPGAISIAGWAFDPETASSIPVHVYVDGVGTAITANGSRPDVGAAFGYGDLHGFATSIPASGGTHAVCVYAINAGSQGDTTVLGCRFVTVPTGPPIGSLDLAYAGPGKVTVAGWAIDPDTASPIAVHVYVDSIGAAFTAGDYRSDLASFFGPYGGNHAFNGSITVPAGTHTVCAYGINVGGGANSTIGCRTVTVLTGSPVGSLDVAARNGNGTISVAGWGLDWDTASPIAVHVYMTAPGQPLTFLAVTAGGARSDIGSILPGYGPNHGFSATTSAAVPSGATVCAYGINVGTGANSSLGCRFVP